MKRLLSILIAAAVILSSAPNVYGASDGISLSADAVTLRMGISKKISVKNKPKGAKVTWKSANKRIASVKDGTVAGMWQGQTVITCQVKYSRSGKKVTKQLKARVTVNKSKSVYPKHQPYGTGIGAKPGRVVFCHNPKSVNWNGKGSWWKTKNFDEKVILKMVRNSIASLGGEKKAKKGWEKLFTAHNKRTGAGKKGYKKGEKIAIKANINGSGVFDDDDSGKTKMSLANLKGHSYGITLCGKNHFGSFINGNEMRPPEGANLHQFLTMDEMGIYSPLVDLMANSELGGKTVLYMLDALVCAPSEGDEITGSNAKWKQYPFNGDYTSSIFVSQDPVAIDSVGADFLMNEPAVTNNNDSLKNNSTVENYLHEAGLVNRAPSGTVYQDGNGKTVKNLGVHEHWQDPVSKKYSRNLGKKEGIELIQIKK